MTYPLLTTKLHVPSVREGAVLRPRLVEQLNTGLHRRLTLVSAPAGFGKTTLVAAWLSSVDCPRTWLSLDEGDNDPIRFFAYLVAALQKVDASIGQSALAMLQSPQPPPSEALLTALINDIAGTAQPLVLVIDDYHVIHVLAIHEQLAFLLERQPSHMHVVLASREDPPLSLPRLRARAQMVEIRQADLTFTEQEAADFMQHTMGLELSTAHLAALYRRTEGWIAGLQLVALSIQRSEDVDGLVQSFASSHRYILDYLIEEVFQQQSAAVQDFLLETSVLERFSASLCDRVTQRDDSGEVLRELEQSNLFIVPLDESRQWYRYHRLFVDLLRHRLEARSHDLVSALHKRASEWYEAAGFPADAVHHALAALDWERAATLIFSANESMMKRGEVATLLRWYQALPDQEVCARPRLCMEYSWVLILTGHLDAAESYLARVETIARQVPLLGGAVAAAQAHIARTRGDDRRTIELSRQALDLLPADDLNARSVVAVNMGLAHWNCGHLAEAEQALTEASQAAEQSGNHYARLVALGFLGVIQATRGKLHRAAELYQQAIRSGQRLPPVALAHNELGALLYEWNDLQSAAEHLQRGIELSKRSANAEIANGTYRILAQVKQAQGSDAAALEALEQAHQTAQDNDLSPLMRARNAACHVQIALAQRDLDTAIHWAERVTEEADASPFYPLLGLTQARLSIAQSQKAPAAERLEKCYETAAREGWQYGLIVVRAMQCLTAPTLEEAFCFLAEALTLAEPEGCVRTFIDLGEPMVKLLSAFSQQRSIRPSVQAYVSNLLAAFATESARPGPEEVTEKPANRQRSMLVEPLSDRELDVLHLLIEGQTNREIALALCVSINTVKTHLQSVYGKLGVNNRRQAASQARTLGLVT